MEFFYQRGYRGPLKAILDVPAVLDEIGKRVRQGERP